MKNLRVLGILASILLLAPGSLLFAQEAAVPAAAPAATTAAATAAATSAAFLGGLPETDLDAGASIETRAAIVNAKALSVEGKWLSAWKALSAADPDNKDGYILAEKVRIALEGHAQTAMLMVFAFVDLEPGQTMAEAQDADPKDFDPIEFDPWTLYEALDASGAAVPPVLSMRLGDYFYAVRAQFSGQWLEDDQTIISRALEQYERAIAYNVYTSSSLVREAEFLFMTDHADQAELFLLKAQALDPQNDTIGLLLIDVYSSQGKTEKATQQIDALVAKAQGQALYRALVKGLQVNLESGHPEKMEPYYEGLEKSFPQDNLAGLVRHLVAVQAGDMQKAAQAADAVMAKFPTNEVLSTLLGTWLSAGHASEGMDFIDRRAALVAGDKEALASLYLYRALLGAEIARAVAPADFAAALADLDKAEALFKDLYLPDHQVFQSIEQLRAQWKQSATLSRDPVPGTPAQGSPSSAAPAAAPASAVDATSAATGD